MANNSKSETLPVHFLSSGFLAINILPLDHTNPYDFKREHRHSYYEIILIEKGGCNQLIDFVNYPGYDFSCYIICPQQIHLMNRNEAKGIVVQFTEDCLNSVPLRAALRELVFKEHAAIVFEKYESYFMELQFFLNIIKKYLYENKETKKELVSSLLEAFVSLIFNYQENYSKPKLNAEKKLLHLFYQLIETNYNRNVGVQFYIENLRTNDKKLAAITKRYTGLSPLQVIHNRIMLEAKRLLLFEETSHKEIAYDLGFDSPASFSAFVKLKSGLTPTELTKQLSEIHK